jgi:hypothetical protein
MFDNMIEGFLAYVLYQARMSNLTPAMLATAGVPFRPYSIFRGSYR